LSRGTLAFAALLIGAPLSGCVHVGLPGDVTPLTGNTTTLQAVSMAPAWRRTIDLGAIKLESSPRRAGGAYDAQLNRLYIAARDGELLCLSGAGGAVLWRADLPGAGRGNAVVDGQQVIVGTDDGYLVAFSTVDGTENWRYQVKGAVAATPVIAGPHVLFVDGSNAIYAVDRQTGAWRWQHRRDPPATFALVGTAAPVVSDDRVFVGFSDGMFVALGLQDGATLWSRDLAPEQERFQDVDAQAVATGGLIYAASAAGGLYAMEPDSGSVRWHASLTGIIGMHSIDGDLLVSVDRGATLRLSALDGKVRWRVRFGKADGVPGEPTPVAGYVAVTTHGGALHMLDADVGRPVQVFRPGSGLHASPAIADDGSIFLLSDGGVLYALRPAQ
jgi:outer membrane protein assembly factor BamB